MAAVAQQMQSIACLMGRNWTIHLFLLISFLGKEEEGKGKHVLPGG